MDVNEPASVNETVTIRVHDGAWARIAADLCRMLEEIIADDRVEIAHIGSTAVPGLDAKPIIDIQIGTPRTSIARVVSDLIAAGFEHIPDAGVAGREYFRRRGDPAVNLHVVEREGHLWNDNIVFRDYLRANPDAAARYMEAKREALQHAMDLLGYSAAKASVVAEILAEARAHFSTAT